MRHLLFTCGVCLLATLAHAADAAKTVRPTEYDQNWPQWRGPAADGVAPAGANPPTEWSETKNIRYKVEIPGHGTSTPVIWNDKLFLITAVKTDREEEPSDPPEAAATAEKAPDASKAASGDKNDKADGDAKDDGKAKGKGKGRPNNFRPKNVHEFIVLCLDRATGKVRWQHVAKEAVPHEGHHPDGSFASASPTTDGKRLYVSFGSRGVYCYDLDGQPLWSRDLGRMKVLMTFGEGASPVVHGDAVIVNWDHQGKSFIMCLDAATGDTRWKVDREEGTSWATPLVIDKDGRTQVIVSGAKRVRSYDLKTGEEIWACGGQAPSCIPCPVSDGDVAYAMTGYMGNALYAIPLKSVGDITKEDDKILWKRKTPGTPYVPSPLLYDGLLYFNSSNKGIISIINAKTGEPVVDRQRLAGIENIYASPVAAGDYVYFTGRDGNTVVLRRGGGTEIVATNKLDDRFDASAAIAGNQFFLRGGRHLYCIAAE